MESQERVLSDESFFNRKASGCKCHGWGIQKILLFQNKPKRRGNKQRNRRVRRKNQKVNKKR